MSVQDAIWKAQIAAIVAVAFVSNNPSLSPSPTQAQIDTAIQLVVTVLNRINVPPHKSSTLYKGEGTCRLLFGGRREVVDSRRYA